MANKGASTPDLEDTFVEPGSATGPAASASVPASAPESIGHFVILRPLGQGGMGEVFSAYDERLDRKVAVKLLRSRPGGGRDEHANQRLIREAQALARLSHPNVVQVYEAGEHGGRVYVAMEFIQGVTLRRWVERARREGAADWRRILARCCDAGRGLAAAHAVGMIHRDFKPENIMVADDGRVRVLDFGLVRTAGDAPDEPARLDGPQPAGASERSRGDAGASRARGELLFTDTSIDSLMVSGASLEQPLTEHGAILGTPAYMSPEQHRGESLDARSDQFSFCVVVYEALLGARPFFGRSRDELREAVLSGRPSTQLVKYKAPDRVIQLLLRGMAPSPEDRWPSMDALLSALTRDPARARRRALGIAGAAGALIVAGGLIARALDDDALDCSGGEAELAESWGQGERARVTAALSSTGLAYAGETAALVCARVDAYARGWVEMSKEACISHRRGRQSDALLDRRMACLDQRLVELRAMVATLSEADPTITTRAVEAASSLRRIEDCGDLALLESAVAPPRDPAVAAAVTELREQLAGVRAAHEAGKFERARELLAPVMARAESIGYAPVLAEALVERGAIEVGLGDYERARASLWAATWKAAEHHHDEVAARAAVENLWVISALQQSLEEAAIYEPVATALVGRLATETALHGRLENTLGGLARNRGETEEARRRLRRAHQIYLRTLGPDHPDIATPLGNLGVVASDQGSIDEAIAFLEQAADIFERSLGGQHPRVAVALMNIGALYNTIGVYEVSIPMLERARELTEQNAGLESGETASVLINLATAYKNTRRGDEAKALLERALAIYAKTLGERHPSVAPALFNLAIIHLESGALELALETFERDLALLDESMGPEHPFVATTLASFSHLLINEGEPELARPYIERALEVLEAQGDAVEPYFWANAQFGLARVLWAMSDDRLGALEAADEAIAVYERLDEHGDELAAVQDWRARVDEWLPP